jgi:hypothetical protein
MDLTQGPAGSGAFDDAGWIRINGAQIKRLLSVFDNDTNVQTAYRVRMNSVLSGGIRFKRRFHSMNEWNSRMFSGYVSDAVRKIWRLKWATGISPVMYKSDPMFGRIPKIPDWDPDHLECMMKPRANGTDTQYRWYSIGDPSPAMAQAPSTGNATRTLLTNVITLVDTQPANDGNVRSLVSTLDRGAHLEEVLFQCCEDAYPRMAIPGIVSEKPEDKLDPDNLRNPMDPLFSSNMHKTLQQLTNTAKSSSLQPVSGEPPQQVNSNAILLNRLLNSRMAMSSGGHTQDMQARWERMARTRQDMGPQLYLPDGRKLSRQIESQAPEKVMLEYMIQRKATICEVFSVPYHMLAAQGSKAGSGPATMKIFNDAQRALHEQILNDLHMIYTWIYSKGDLAAFFQHKASELKGAKQRNMERKSKKRKLQQDGDEQPPAKEARVEEEEGDEEMEKEEWVLDEKEMRLFTEVQIRLPALPDFDVMLVTVLLCFRLMKVIGIHRWH